MSLGPGKRETHDKRPFSHGANNGGALSVSSNITSDSNWSPSKQQTLKETQDFIKKKTTTS